MITAQLVKRLQALQVDLSVSATGKLHVEAPAGALTEELRAALADHRDALLAVARETALARPRVSDFPPSSVDPRPDLTDDAEQWARLLPLAWARDASDRCGVYGSLLGMRCLGVRLAAGRRTLSLRPRTEPPGDPPAWVTPEQYRDERQRWLDPHREAVIALLEAAAR